MEETRDYALGALEAAALRLEKALLERNLWLKRAWKAGAKSKQLGDAAKLGPSQALALAKKKLEHSEGYQEADGPSGIVRVREPEEH